MFTQLSSQTNKGNDGEDGEWVARLAVTQQERAEGKARQGTFLYVLQGSVALESPTKNTIINKNVTNMFVGM